MDDVTVIEAEEGDINELVSKRRSESVRHDYNSFNSSLDDLL